MKLTKLKLQEIIKEELKILFEVNPEAASAMLGKARVSQDFDEPEPESDWVDIGERGPTKDDLIRAAELLEINPDNDRNTMVLYNIATLLRNRPDAPPALIVKAIRNAWEEADLVGGGPLQEDYRSQDEAMDTFSTYLLNKHRITDLRTRRKVRKQLEIAINDIIELYD